MPVGLPLLAVEQAAESGHEILAGAFHPSAADALSGRESLGTVQSQPLIRHIAPPV